jgi:hypothetical protein
MAGGTPDKARVGSPLRIRTGTWNEVVDSKDDYTKRRLLGVPKEVRHIPLATDKIKVQNDTGSDRREGEVASIDNVILLDIVDPEHLWQSAIATDTDDVLPFGIFRHPTPDGEIDELQVSGVCKAIINITDVSHTHAKPTYHSHVLASDTSGPLRILYQPGVIGEKECIVIWENKERPLFAEAFLQADMCPTDDDAEQIISVTGATYLPNCAEFTPSKVTNPRHHRGPDGAKVLLILKACPDADEEWQVVDVELTKYCAVIGIEDRPTCLVSAGLQLAGEWCPSDEPILACKVVEYTDCTTTLGICDDSWTFEPLFACCGQDVGATSASQSQGSSGDNQRGPGPLPGQFLP